MFRKFICAAVFGLAFSPVWAAEWLNDWDAAKTRAAKEGKPLLVSFTGSDWCVPCARLHKAVFENPEFDAYVQGKFVLMEVDMPHNHPQPEKLAKQNQQLCHDYLIEGFPTVMVMTPEGRLVGGFSGALKDFPQVRQRLDAALENRVLLEKAEAMAGEARARGLYTVFKRMPEKFRMVSGLAEELAAADPDNVTGFLTEQSVMLQWAEISRKVDDAGTDRVRLRTVVTEAIETALPPNKEKLEKMLAQMDFSEIYRQVDAMSGNPAAAVAFLEIKAKEVPDAILGDVLTLLAEMQVQAADSVEDILKAKASMEHAFLVAPPSPAFRAYFEKRFADPASFLEEVKQHRRH